MELSTKSATELLRLMETFQVTSVDILQSVFKQIDTHEMDINAYLTMNKRDVLEKKAHEIDKKRQKGIPVGRLAGIPIAVKDNICTKGLRTTCASKMLENFVPPYDAHVIDCINDSEGLILGKTNMDEFAMGSSTENSAFQVTRNPRNLDYVPGGTSGGSAAAIASNEAIMALASDTGGSIRQPASFCGVVGLKPTYGRISRYGLVAYGSSLDQIGVLTKSVEDAALMLSVIAGYDSKDSTSINVDVPDYCNALEIKQKLKIGVPKEFFNAGLDQEVADQFYRAISRLEKRGHEIVDISIPSVEYAVAAYYIIVSSEASSNLSRYSGTLFGHRSSRSSDLIDMYVNSRTEGFGTEVKRRILMGTYSLSAGFYDAFYAKASKVRTIIKEELQTCFKHCDFVAHPVAPTAAYLIGEKVDDPLSMYLGDIYSVIANMTGLPAISIPAGSSKNNLPIGLQLTSNYFTETELLSAAHTVSTQINMHDDTK